MTWTHLPRYMPFASVAHYDYLHGLLLINRPRKDERLSWPRWLTSSGQFTYKVATCPAIGQVQDRESSPGLPLCYAVNKQSVITCICASVSVLELSI